MRIKISDTKAIQVTGIDYKGQKLVSLRQMYRKKGQKEWLPGKQGLTIDPDFAVKVRKAIKSIVDEDVYEKVGQDKDED